jgi:two-component system NarL family response regulator
MILLASSQPDALARWAGILEGFASLGAVDRLGAIRDALAELTVQLLLLDLDMPGVGSAVAVAALASFSPATRIVVLSGPLDDERELALFRAGAWGCCRRDIDAQLLKRVVHAVGLGEIWIRRSLTKRLIDELGRDETPREGRMRTRLASLTHREQQIAALVGSGGSNKQIARALAISERTVKAHLTEIFRKVGTADRLKLALLLSRNA